MTYRLDIMDLRPWRTACDVIDAPPRTFDLVLAIGLCFALLLARVTSALRDWRRR